MNETSRIRLGILALLLVVSCGSRPLGRDSGSLDMGQADGSGAAGGPGGAGPGAAGAGGRGGGPGAGGSLAGQSGAGTGGTFTTGGSGGRGGAGGTMTTGGTGGRGGVGGTMTTGGTGGRGGVGGTMTTGGTGGRGGVGGTMMTGGTGGRGGVGGTMITGGTGGGGGVAGTFVTGGAGGRGGVGGTMMTGGTGGRGGVGGTMITGGTGGTSGSGGSGGTGGAVCLTCRATIVPIAGRDVAYSAARNEIYVSVAGDAPAYPNTIVVVDPSTGSVLSAIPVGSDPGALAISDDGSTLWVGIDGAHAFRKVTMTSTPPVVGPLVHLPKARPNSYFNAASMAVLAGTSLSVAVVLSEATYNTEVRLFDDGVQRGTGMGLPGASFVTAGPPGFVFGAHENSGTFYVYRASPSGLVQQEHFSVLRAAPNDIAYLGGRVITSSGDAINVENPTTPTWAGSMPYQGPVAARDPMTLMMLTTSGFGFPFNPRAEIRLFSNVLLAQFGLAPLPASLGPVSRVYQNLVYAGGDAVAFLRGDYTPYGATMTLVIMHDPTFGTPIGGGGGASGTGGAGGTGGGGGTGGVGGTGGAPDLCPGCTFTTIQAYGRDMAPDPIRNLIYVASDASAPSHPSSIVTVDPAAGAVTSIVPVGNDPQSLALSDDASALWVGLAAERRVRRMTPGPTPVPGPAYSLPMLLTTGDPSVPYSLVVLAGMPSSIAVNVFGPNNGGRGVFILDDGQPRANYIQPPEVGANFLTNGPPGYLFALGDAGNLVVFRLGTVGATLESHFGLLSNYYQSGFAYSAGYGYVSNGDVIDLTNPDNPLPAGHFPFANCALAVRSPTRVMMMCPNPIGGGPILRILDPTTFTQVGSVTLPDAQGYQAWVELAYLGGDALALLGYYTPLEILRAPIIGTPP